MSRISKLAQSFIDSEAVEDNNMSDESDSSYSEVEQESIVPKIPPRKQKKRSVDRESVSGGGSGPSKQGQNVDQTGKKGKKRKADGKGNGKDDNFEEVLAMPSGSGDKITNRIQFASVSDEEG